MNIRVTEVASSIHTRLRKCRGNVISSPHPTSKLPPTRSALLSPEVRKLRPLPHRPGIWTSKLTMHVWQKTLSSLVHVSVSKKSRVFHRSYQPSFDNRAKRLTQSHISPKQVNALDENNCATAMRNAGTVAQGFLASRRKTLPRGRLFLHRAGFWRQDVTGTCERPPNTLPLHLNRFFPCPPAPRPQPHKMTFLVIQSPLYETVRATDSAARIHAARLRRAPSRVGCG